MKNKILILMLLGVLSLSGCRTIPRQPPSPWPVKSPMVSLYYVPKPMASAEEAVGTIKNLQRNFVEWSSGIAFSSLDVDNYGIRARWEWTQRQRRTVAVPTYGAVFTGWNYYPTYSTTFATQIYEQPMSDMLVIPANEVKGFSLFHLPYLPMEFKWGLAVSLSGKPVHLRVSDREHLFQLADAIATLAMQRGAQFDKFWFGCTVSPLTEEQSLRMGLTPGTGILVVDVAQDSSAEKAGIRFLDVILEFDGRACNRPQDLGEAVKAAYQAGKKSAAIRLAHLEMVPQAIENPRTKKMATELVERKQERVIQAALIY